MHGSEGGLEISTRLNTRLKRRDRRLIRTTTTLRACLVKDWILAAEGLGTGVLHVIEELAPDLPCLVSRPLVQRKLLGCGEDRSLIVRHCGGGTEGLPPMSSPSLNRVARLGSCWVTRHAYCIRTWYLSYPCNWIAECGVWGSTRFKKVAARPSPVGATITRSDFLLACTYHHGHLASERLA